MGDFGRDAIVSKGETRGAVVILIGLEGVSGGSAFVVGVEATIGMAAVRELGADSNGDAFFGSGAPEGPLIGEAFFPFVASIVGVSGSRIAVESLRDVRTCDRCGGRGLGRRRGLARCSGCGFGAGLSSGRSRRFFRRTLIK